MFFELNDGKTYGAKFSRSGTTTYASLYVVLDDGTLLNTGICGIATKHPRDRFVKSTGRKVALASLLRLIDNLPLFPNLTKEDRKGIWDIYFKTHKK